MKCFWRYVVLKIKSSLVLWLIAFVFRHSDTAMQLIQLIAKIGQRGRSVTNITLSSSRLLHSVETLYQSSSVQVIARTDHSSVHFLYLFFVGCIITVLYILHVRCFVCDRNEDTGKIYILRVWNVHCSTVNDRSQALARNTLRGTG